MSTSSPASSASPPDIPGLSWRKAPDVARPDAAFGGTTAASVAPDATNRAGHPGHYVGQAIVSDVAAAADGTMVAVGSIGVDGSWTAAAWTSTDGASWRVSAIDTSPESFAQAVAATPEGTNGSAIGPRFVAVGRSGTDAVAWSTMDGSSWTRGVLPSTVGSSPLPRSEAERATSVLVARAGIIVGGSRGPELGSRVARIWQSADGRTWTAVPDAGAFADGEITALATGPHGVVAVGHSGPGQAPTGSLAWWSNPDGSWTRADDPVLAHLLIGGIAALPDGGLVAVGSGLDQQPAAALHSADGRSWTAAPDQSAFVYHGLKIVMTDVVSVPAGVVAVGFYTSIQRPTGMSWTSPDGLAWTRSQAAPDLQQGVLTAIARAGGRLVAVGDYGLPDDFVPTVWLGTTPGS